MVFALNYFACLFVFFFSVLIFTCLSSQDNFQGTADCTPSGWLLTLFRGALIVRLIFGEQKGREMRLQNESIRSDFNLKLTEWLDADMYNFLA